VFAVPGDIFRETSQGTNQLIARGEAKCVHTAKDILEEYFDWNTSLEQRSLLSEKTWESEEQKNVYEAIENGYNTPDSIGETT
jgi:predicted Rossmann fold nucleotide-binding protein DprA/Smf involved in DNA uptake